LIGKSVEIADETSFDDVDLIDSVAMIVVAVVSHVDLIFLLHGSYQLYSGY